MPSTRCEWSVVQTNTNGVFNVFFIDIRRVRATPMTLNVTPQFNTAKLVTRGGQMSLQLLLLPAIHPSPTHVG